MESITPATYAKNFQAFFMAYVECALWSSTDEDGEQLDANGADDIAPDCLDNMLSDCADFYKAQREAIAALPNYTVEQAGHDFWLSRNGHGAGFWDRGLGKAGDDLHNAAKVYGSCDLYRGGDGLIYC